MSDIAPKKRKKTTIKSLVGKSIRELRKERTQHIRAIRGIEKDLRKLGSLGTGVSALQKGAK